jgi:hypothetical protein
MVDTLHLKSSDGHRLVGVHFLDHAEGRGKPDDLQPDDTRDDSPFECYVMGILTKEDDKAYYVTSWVCDKDFNDWETRVDTILKSTLLSPILFLADLVNIKGLPETEPVALY